MTIRIEPWKRGSRSARVLSQATGVLRATPQQVRRHGTFDIIINWGSSERRFNYARYINDPTAVGIATDKRLAFERFAEHGVSAPRATTDQETAQGWLDEGSSVVVRHRIAGNSGAGIQIYNAGRVSGERGDTAGGDVLRNGRVELPRAPLYTEYVKKADEYRVHVFDGQVIDAQQKRKREEVPNEEVDYQVRNLDGGWVFCRDGVDLPTACRDAAVAAVASLGLTFGAVDIGYNRHYSTAYVFEVNTAPGLEGTTIERYRDAFISLLPQLATGAYARRRRA